MGLGRVNSVDCQLVAVYVFESFKRLRRTFSLMYKLCDKGAELI